MRGRKSKLRAIHFRLMEASTEFPTTFFNGLYSLKMPAHQRFIETLDKRNAAILEQSFFECAQRLKDLKGNRKAKICVLVFPDNMWRTELIIFEDENTFHNFLNQKIDSGIWRANEIHNVNVEQINWERKGMMEQIDEEQIVCILER